MHNTSNKEQRSLSPTTQNNIRKKLLQIPTEIKESEQPRLLEFERTDEVLKLDHILSQHDLQNKEGCSSKNERMSSPNRCPSKHALGPKKYDTRMQYCANPRMPLTIPKSIPKSSIIGLKALFKALERASKANAENREEIPVQKRQEVLSTNEQATHLNEPLNTVYENLNVVNKAKEERNIPSHKILSSDFISCLMKEDDFQKNEAGLRDTDQGNNHSTVMLFKNVVDRNKSTETVSTQTNNSDIPNHNNESDERRNRKQEKKHFKNNKLDAHQKCNKKVRHLHTPEMVKTKNKYNKNVQETKKISKNVDRYNVEKGIKNKNSMKVNKAERKIVDLSDDGFITSRTSQHSSDDQEKYRIRHRGPDSKFSTRIQKAPNKNKSSDSDENGAYFGKNSSANTQTDTSAINRSKLLGRKMQNLNLIDQNGDYCSSLSEESCEPKLDYKRLLSIRNKLEARDNFVPVAKKISYKILKRKIPKKVKSKAFQNLASFRLSSGGNKQNTSDMYQKVLKERMMQSWNKLNPHQEINRNLKTRKLETIYKNIENGTSSSLSSGNGQDKRKYSEDHKFYEGSRLRYKFSEESSDEVGNEYNKSFYKKAKSMFVENTDIESTSSFPKGDSTDDDFNFVKKNEEKCLDFTLEDLEAALNSEATMNFEKTQVENYTLIDAAKKYCNTLKTENGLINEIEGLKDKLFKYVQYIGKCQELIGAKVRTSSLKSELKREIESVSNLATEFNVAQNENKLLKKQVSKYEKSLLKCECPQCRKVLDDIIKLEIKIKKIDTNIKVSNGINV